MDLYLVRLKSYFQGKQLAERLDNLSKKRYLKSTMENEFHELINDFKAYLEYLKGMGIPYLFSNQENSKDTLTLEEIRNQLGDCKRCRLYQGRRTIVFGEGNEEAKLMIIGEAPGFDEDVQGKPFVGKAGQLLTRILQSINLKREEVYITNVIKCRPPQNRNPKPDEIKSCYPFLIMQIQTISPKIICALGTFSAQTLLNTEAKITTLRGKIYDFKGIKVVPTYHPAYLLRNPDKKREVWEDMKRISKMLKES
jgi:DNA polymerase